MKSFKQKNVVVPCFEQGQNTANKSLELDLSKPKMSFNVKNQNGMLVCANGFEHFKTPLSANLPNELTFDDLGALTIKKMWPYKYYSLQNGKFEYLLVAYMSDGKLYYTVLFVGDTCFHLVANSPTFSSAPEMIYFSVDGIERMAIASDSSNLVVWYGDSLPQISQSVLPQVYSAVEFNGRIFSLSKAHANKVFYSSPSSSKTWSENMADLTNGGNIEIVDRRGKLNKVVTMGDYVYVFMDFGIARINQYSFNTFTVSTVFVSSSKIYPESVCVSKDSIYFLTEDGLYAYQNLSVKKIELGFEDAIVCAKQDYARVCTHANKIFLACKMVFDDALSANETSFKNNVLVEFDLDEKKSCITRGVDVEDMTSVNFYNANKLVVVVRDSDHLWQLSSNGKFGTNVLVKHWESTIQNFGDVFKTKILKKFHVENSSAVTLTAKTEDIQKPFALAQKSGLQSVIVNVPFKSLQICFDSTDENFCLGKAQFDFKVEK